MAEDDSSSDLDVQLEWPQGEEPSIDVGESRSLARRTRRELPVPTGMEALTSRIDELGRAVSRLDAQLAEHGARIDAAQQQAAWDSERILAKLDVLRETTKDLRRVRDTIGSFVERRASRETELQACVTELSQEVQQLRQAVPPGGGKAGSVAPDAVQAIAEAVSASLSPEAGAGVKRSAKRPAKRPVGKKARAPAKKTAAKKTPAKKAAATTRKR